MQSGTLSGFAEPFLPRAIRRTEGVWCWVSRGGGDVKRSRLEGGATGTCDPRCPPARTGRRTGRCGKLTDMVDDAKPKVLVLGGGFGGLETAFSLRKMVRDEAAITLVSDLDHFYFKPNSIYVPFGLDPPNCGFRSSRPTQRKGIELVQARATGVDPDARRVQTGSAELDYDFLVIATGAGMRAEEIPGLPDYAHGTWTAEDMLKLRDSFNDLLEGSRGAPGAGCSSWSLPTTSAPDRSTRSC